MLRKRFQLEQEFRRIDWEEDVLLPQIEALKAGKSVLGLPAGTAFDIVIEHANPDPPAPSTDSK